MMESKKSTDKELEKTLAYIKATLAIEDLYLTGEEEKLLRRYAAGEITKEEYYKLYNI